mmetsp:Transcript_32643/g.66631  ORF Transcript_32643/g.66631 Transcript_32643/m.66631 type:complete len:81 (+) Transcript_32643:115-357(+)
MDVRVRSESHYVDLSDRKPRNDLIESKLNKKLNLRSPPENILSEKDEEHDCTIEDTDLHDESKSMYVRFGAVRDAFTTNE